MKRMLCLLAVFLLLGVCAFGQQDPNDPGAQDSIIISSAQGKIPDSVQIDIFIKTIDSISFFNIPLAWKTTCPAIYPVRCSYSDLANDFDVTGHIVYKTNQIRLFGSSNSKPICTNGQLRKLLSLRFTIDEGANAKSVAIDTSVDEDYGQAYFKRYNSSKKIIPAIASGEINIKAGNSEIKISEDSSSSTGLRLSPNYPNPFSPQTNFNFTIDSSQTVKIIIFNITGMAIDSIEAYSRAGYNSVMWNPRSIPSGVYLYKIISQKDTINSKIVLMR